ncbi:MAG: YkgJ family cysteine cluster protein [Candidatus Aenigmatarchaeota archaeon]
MNICQKCRECCKFKKDEEYFAPLFTKEEIKIIGAKKNLFKKKGSGVYQIKLVKSKINENILVCPFLNEETHLCKIYPNRPFDCKFWPFIFMKDRKSIILGCFKKDYCEITKQMSEEEFKKYLLSIFDWIKTNKIEELIKNYPDLIWEKENDVIVLRKFSI